MRIGLSGAVFIMKFPISATQGPVESDGIERHGLIDQA